MEIINVDHSNRLAEVKIMWAHVYGSSLKSSLRPSTNTLLKKNEIIILHQK